MSLLKKIGEFLFGPSVKIAKRDRNGYYEHSDFYEPEKVAGVAVDVETPTFQFDPDDIEVVGITPDAKPKRKYTKRKTQVKKKTAKRIVTNRKKTTAKKTAKKKAKAKR